MVNFLDWLELNIEKPANIPETDFLLTTTNTTLDDIKNKFKIASWHFRWTKKPYSTTLQLRFKAQSKELQKLQKFLNKKLRGKSTQHIIEQQPNYLFTSPERDKKTARNIQKLLQLTSEITIELIQNNKNTDPELRPEDPLTYAQKYTNLLLNQLQPLLKQTSQPTTTDFYLQQGIAHHATTILREIQPNLPKETILDAIGQIQEKTAEETKNDVQQKIRALLQNCPQNAKAKQNPKE